MWALVENRVFFDRHLLGEVVALLCPTLELFLGALTFAKQRFPGMRRTLVVLPVHFEEGVDEFIGAEFVIEREHDDSFGRQQQGRSMLRPYMSSKLCFGVFSVVADGVHQWLVIHHKENGGIFGCVFMPMRIPKRHDERISLFPFIAFISDVGDAAAAPDVVDRRAGVAMALGFLAGAEHVNLTGHGWQCRPAGYRVSVIQHDAVVRITGLLANLAQRVLGVCPLVTESRRLN